MFTTGLGEFWVVIGIPTIMLLLIYIVFQLFKIVELLKWNQGRNEKDI